MEEAAAQPEIRSRANYFRNDLRYTNFYPLYNGANDQVDPVLPVRRVQFQRVLPRYRLSTSETRDQGVGPMFTEVSANPLRRARAAETPGAAEAGVRSLARNAAHSNGADRRSAGVLEPWKGSRVDLLA